MWSDKRVIFCLTGGTFSGNFLDCWGSLLNYCSQNGIQAIVSRKESSNVYFVRNMCLGADVARGANQKPFDGKVDYTHLMWIDSDVLFTPAQFPAHTYPSSKRQRRTDKKFTAIPAFSAGTSESACHMVNHYLANN